MEEITRNAKSIEEKLKELNDFIALSLKRNEMTSDLRRLQMQANKVGALVTHAHELMQSELENVQRNYEDAMARTRNLQSTLMDHLIDEKLQKLKLDNYDGCGDQIDNAIDGETKPPAAITTTAKAYGSTSNALIRNQHSLSNNTKCVITPKMKISEYKESPLIKRKVNAVPIMFSDFEAKITQEQFDQLPKYMCGRETLSQLNIFLETIIIPCFNEKYQLMYRPRSSVRKPEELELWKTYNTQASYLPKERFITSDDVVRKLNKLIDKKTQNRLVILRHVRIINEIRMNQITCYIWTA